MSGGANNLRDISADEFGNIHAFNGTSASIGPVTLTTVDQVTGLQTDQGNVDFSTAGVVGYGGIAVLGDRVFVNDTQLSGFTTFDAASDVFNVGYHVAFTSPISAVPEPGTSFALLFAVGWCTTRRRRSASAVRISR